MKTINSIQRWTFWSFLVALSVCFLALQSLDVLSLWHEEVAIIMILLLGIPHGALDHIIFRHRRKTSVSNDSFIFIYLNIMMLYVVCWMIIPHISFMVFLLFTAYHFGQSQLNDLNIVQWIKSVLYMLWGVALLCFMISFNIDEFQVLYCPVLPSDFVCNLSHNTVLFSGIISLGLFILLSALQCFQGKIKTPRFVNELVIFSGIVLCFYALPLLLGFSLYFIFLHSFRVLNEEYSFLQHQVKGLLFSTFIKKLLPLSIVSIVGLLLIMYIGETLQMSTSLTGLLIIAISVLTLPHVLVMEGFYGQD